MFAKSGPESEASSEAFLNHPESLGRIIISIKGPNFPGQRVMQLNHFTYFPLWPRFSKAIKTLSSPVDVSDTQALCWIRPILPAKPRALSPCSALKISKEQLQYLSVAAAWNYGRCWQFHAYASGPSTSNHGASWWKILVFSNSAMAFAWTALRQTAGDA